MDQSVPAAGFGAASRPFPASVGRLTAATVAPCADGIRPDPRVELRRNGPFLASAQSEPKE